MSAAPDLDDDWDTSAAAAKDWDWGDPAPQSSHPRTPWDPHGVGLAPPRTPKPLPVGVNVSMPVLSTVAEPADRVRDLRPTDLRMQNWLLCAPAGAGPVRYTPGKTIGSTGNWWEGVLTWERRGEFRRCPAQPLRPYSDMWSTSTWQLIAELEKRCCTCGAADWPGGSLCVCAHEVTGWTQYDEFWVEPEFGASVGVGTGYPDKAAAPVPKRHRTLPAQYPLSTWRGRLRDRLWRWTHLNSKES